MDVTTDSTPHVVAQRVRFFRRQRGWTLEELSQRSGVSRRMIISIEQGQANPSIGTLLRLSSALHVSFPTLVAGGESDQRRLPADYSTTLWHGEHGGSARMVSSVEAHVPAPGKTDVGVELWDWTLGPGDWHTSEPHPAHTREILYVLSGQVVALEGTRRHTLDVGDSLALRGDEPHAYGNDSAEAARFILTVSEPRESNHDRETL